MSETVTPPHDASPGDVSPDAASDVAPVPSQPAELVANADHGPASAPPPALAVPADMHAAIELIGRGLAPAADESARAIARELFGRFASAEPSLPSGAMVPAGAPATSPVPANPAPSAAMMPGPRAQLSPDQLLDLLLARLRASLPAGATVANPRGIQFQLIPVPPDHAR